MLRGSLSNRLCAPIVFCSLPWHHILKRYKILQGTSLRYKMCEISWAVILTYDEEEVQRLHVIIIVVQNCLYVQSFFFKPEIHKWFTTDKESNHVKKVTCLFYYIACFSNSKMISNFKQRWQSADTHSSKYFSSKGCHILSENYSFFGFPGKTWSALCKMSIFLQMTTIY